MLTILWQYNRLGARCGLDHFLSVDLKILLKFKFNIARHGVVLKNRLKNLIKSSFCVWFFSLVYLQIKNSVAFIKKTMGRSISRWNFLEIQLVNSIASTTKLMGNTKMKNVLVFIILNFFLKNVQFSKLFSLKVQSGEYWLKNDQRF